METPLTDHQVPNVDPLEALGRGDPRPFEEFILRDTGTLLAFFRRMGADATEAEDLTQDLALKLYRHAKDYQPQGRFTAYTFRVARNLWIDRSRRRGREPRRVGIEAGGADNNRHQFLDTLPDLGQTDPSDRLERQDEARHLMLGLETLSEGHRIVFELGVMQELPYVEISEILEIPEGTVKSRMFHAVRKMRSFLTDRENGSCTPLHPPSDEMSSGSVHPEPGLSSS